MSPITTHILDTARGGAAAGVPLTLYRLDDGGWTELAARKTDAEGRVKGLVEGIEAATYKIHFDTGAYFSSIGVEGFYPYAEVVFSIRAPSEHYHVPLLLSPFGYSTYRGS